MLYGKSEIDSVSAIEKKKILYLVLVLILVVLVTFDFPCIIKLTSYHDVPIKARLLGNDEISTGDGRKILV